MLATLPQTPLSRPRQRRPAAWIAIFAAGIALLPAFEGAALAELDGERLKQVVPKIVAQKSRKQRDVGAGVVLAVDRDEIVVLTAYHVIEDAGEIEVTFYDKPYKSFAARPFRRIDEGLDVAVVVVEVENARQTFPDLPTVELGDAAKLAEGDQVFPLGHPLDSIWRISRDNTVEDLTDDGDARQLRFTLGSIDKGSSGGPLFDQGGALVGMVTRKHPLHGVAVRVDAVRCLLEEWHVKTPNLIPLPEFGTLIVETRPAGARVRLDGEHQGISGQGALEIGEVTPGRHTVEVAKPPGYRKERMNVVVTAGETQRVLARLDPILTRAPFLVMVSGPEDDPGRGSAEATLLGRLAASGYSVVDRGQVDQTRHGEGLTDSRLAAIAEHHGAEVIVFGRLRSDSQPAMGKFHSGGAVLDLRCFRASTGEVLAGESLRVGDHRVPRVLGPSELAARTAASEAVAEMAAEMMIQQVVPKLKKESPPAPGLEARLVTVRLEG